jgi:DNA modification methylase
MFCNILVGDCRQVLQTLPAGSVQMCCTSPPYYGLRDYGVAGQIGLEKSPDDYVAQMVAVFREVKRVLRDDGTLFLNLGDSYAQGGSGGASSKSTLKNDGRPVYGARAHEQRLNECAFTRKPPVGYKPKDLLGIPWLVAFALRADGWWLRSEIIWHKPNPMPESVRDRPTSAHEKVFLFAKSERYFYDADAVREPLSAVSLSQIEYAQRNGERSERLEKLCPDRNDTNGRLAARGRGARGAAMNPQGANLRNVWTITPRPYKGAHFAVMPPELAERCIKAGSKSGDTVLDPFAGAGTTALAAGNLGRSAILIELRQEYARMAWERLGMPLFTEAAD